MKLFPLFSPYPLKNTLEAKKANPFLVGDKTEKPKNVTISDPIQMLYHCFEHFAFDSSLKRDFRNAFDDLRNDMHSQGVVPNPDRVPEAILFQSAESTNESKLLNEIQQYGANLSVEQVLYHGGDFTESDLCNFGKFQPLSTTFYPEIAIWHAYNDGIGKWDVASSPEPKPAVNPAILVLKVGRDFRGKALIYLEGGKNMEDEREALLAPSFFLGITKKFEVNKNKDDSYRNVTVYEAELVSN